MKITPRSEAMQITRTMDSTNFTGQAGAHDLVAGGGQAIFAAVVRFESEARNHWHSHAGGQVLHVLEGEGWVQARGQAPQRIKKDDTVVADPGEEHWHGAGSGGPMVHLAVAAGETRWLEESAPPPP
jgi:quercetin dioxygenase-like cupin family protein